MHRKSVAGVNLRFTWRTSARGKKKLRLSGFRACACCTSQFLDSLAWCFSPVILVFRHRLCSKQTEMKHKAVYHISDSCVVITSYSTMYYNSMYNCTVQKLYKSNVKLQTNANCSPLHSQEYEYGCILLIFQLHTVFLFWLHLLDFIVVPCIKQHARPR